MRFYTLIGLALAAVMVSAAPVEENTGATDENILTMLPYYKRDLEDTNDDRSLYRGGYYGGGRGGYYGGGRGGYYGGGRGGYYGGGRGGYYGGGRGGYYGRTKTDSTTTRSRSTKQLSPFRLSFLTKQTLTKIIRFHTLVGIAVVAVLAGVSATFAKIDNAVDENIFLPGPFKRHHLGDINCGEEDTDCAACGHSSMGY
ncbi:hypothetical protein BGZ52_009080, partial [Haplosporangium bisporale]